jgi:hypothetical protein
MHVLVLRNSTLSDAAYEEAVNVCTISNACLDVPAWLWDTPVFVRVIVVFRHVSTELLILGRRDYRAIDNSAT